MDEIRRMPTLAIEGANQAKVPEIWRTVTRCVASTAICFKEPLTAKEAFNTELLKA